jgi:hypothetical protein
MTDERGKVLQVRINDAEERDFAAAAKIEGLTKSAWARGELRRAARRILSKAGKRPAINGR